MPESVKPIKKVTSDLYSNASCFFFFSHDNTNMHLRRKRLSFIVICKKTSRDSSELAYQTDFLHRLGFFSYVEPVSETLYRL